MTASRAYSTAGLLLSLAAGLAIMPRSMAGQTAPVLVTTDTPQYCLHLLDQVSELMRLAPSAPPEVSSLSTEGQRMCGQGQTRGGIMRLRRALVLLKQQNLPP
ncbi:MAG TPA: hypothetical protein VFN42_13705 [Acetobacteraceae bacterium]|nr:hypothetical protein [Acetobacteraceae bacterium]